MERPARKHKTDNQENSSTDYQKPVAYDSEGRPLYAAPPVVLTPSEQTVHQVVHVARSVTPVEQEISPEVKERHDESTRHFPNLNLSEGEYVVSMVRRHIIGLVVPVVMTIMMIALVATLIITYPMMMDSIAFVDPPAYAPVIFIGVLVIALFAIGGYIAVWVYTNNTFYLTNESVIQEIQSSVFARREQTVSLGNIEDASYTQRGIVQSLFNYGSIRLSTEGDETTYRFDYVANPKQHIAILNNAVEAFKNGRPVEG